MYLFANQNRAQSAWAAKDDEALRERGKSNAKALRCLGRRWLKIIWKMWQAHAPYHADLRMKNQLAHGSRVRQLSP